MKPIITRNTSQRGRAKEIFLKIETNRHEKSFPKRRSKRLLSKVILQEKTSRSEGNLRTDTQNRNTNTRETAPKEADDKETMLKTNQILQEKCPTKN
jgi:hypothetical protein